MTSTDVDKVYIERIKPRLIEGTLTEDIRRWSVSAHSVMEVTGPSPFGENGNVLLWLHEKSLTQLFDMCDAVDERFSEIEQAATLGSGECEFVSSKGSDYPPVCSACGYELGIYDCEWYEDGTYGYERNYCPNCGKAVKR